MKAPLYVLLLLSLGFQQLRAQCNSNRYIDTVFSQVNVRSQIQYGTADPYGLLNSQNLYLNFYEPIGDTLSKRPLIIYQFGGAYQIGDKSQPPIPEYANYYTRLGYTFAAIDYRIGFNTLDGQSAMRAVYRAIQDVRAAMRFFGQRAAQYRIDTNAIILTGSSAGCITSFHSAFMTDADRPAAASGIFLEPEDLGCLDCSGNTDNGGRSFQPIAIVNQWGAILDTSYINPIPRENIPVISFHGTQDLIVPYVEGPPFNLPIFPSMHGTFRIHERLRNLGVQEVLVPLNGYGHEPELLNPEVKDTVLDRSRVFLYEVLKPAFPQITGNASICLGDTSVYRVPSHPGSKYCWSLPTGAQVIGPGNQATITVLWADTGTYTISVQETDLHAASGDQAFFTTRVNPVPQALFSLLQNELTVQLTNQSSGYQQSLLSFGNGFSTANADTTYRYPSPGTYRIDLRVDLGQCSDVYSTTVTVDSCPVAAFNFLNLGDSILFDAENTNAIVYVWDFGDGGVDTANGGYHRYAQSGDYVVNLRVRNALGCEDSISRTVTILLSGVNDIADQGFRIVPNPAIQYIQVMSPEEISGMSLIAVDGRYLADLVSVAHERWELPSVSSGIYLLKIRHARGNSVVKLMVNP